MGTTLLVPTVQPTRKVVDRVIPALMTIIPLMVWVVAAAAVMERPGLMVEAQKEVGKVWEAARMESLRLPVYIWDQEAAAAGMTRALVPDTAVPEGTPEASYLLLRARYR